MDFRTYIIAHILKFPVPEEIPKIPIPVNTFGIFATIRRNKKLDKWPEDIHGCIGYWENNVMSPDSIIQHLLDVSLSAMYNDNRRNYFPPLEIEPDPETVIEIDFMLHPLITVDTNTGLMITDTSKNNNNNNNNKNNKKRFNNAKWGLIVSNNKTNKRATYLPGVFPDISWPEIKNSLLGKAGITTMEPVSFQAYQIPN